MSRFAPVDWKTLEAVFLAAGFHFKRQEGSHRSYVKEGVARPVVIPTYNAVPVFIIRNNLKTANTLVTNISAFFNDIVETNRLSVSLYAFSGSDAYLP